ncbi:hypothetical protein Tco_0696979 [Tanacetum coccineum]
MKTCFKEIYIVQLGIVNQAELKLLLRYKGFKTMGKNVAGTRYCSSEMAGNVRWQYEVAAAGQSEHDTCPKRVIQGCQACVSLRLSCGDPRK